MSNVSYTFENANGCRSLIDHCLVSENLNGSLKKVYVYDSVNNTSDHVALMCELCINVEYMDVKSSKRSVHSLWYKASIHDIERYKCSVNERIDNIQIPNCALDCRDIDCVSHQHELNKYYEALITEVCLAASQQVLPSCGNQDKSGHTGIVPGWNEFVAHKKAYALECHWLWKAAGRPNSGQLFENRKLARADYHHAVRMVKKNEDKLRSEKMASGLKSKNLKKFWQEVNRLKGRKKTLPIMVDGTKGDVDIAEIFANKYKNLYTSVPYDKNVLNQVTSEVSQKLGGFSVDKIQESLFTVSDIRAAVKHLSCGKSDGQVGLFSDHIIHGTDKLFYSITCLFNAMTVHGVTPKDMLSSVMLPIVKNKRVQSNCSDNFRAICLQSVLCKLLDLVLLDREKQSLITSELQFGFKAKHSTAIATSVLLQTVDYYIENGGRVYGLALDATKAFDRVEYSMLFKLLVSRGMNPLYVRLLMQMYVNQKVCVRYNGSKSEWFCPTNGVKQGGVLSPTLFSIYIDGMLKQLEHSNIGCNVGPKYCGVIGYADDVFLLSPTQGAMNKMIYICESYAEKYMIKFNGNKCQSVVFSKGECDAQPRFKVNNEVVTCVNEIVYLGYAIKGNRLDPLVTPIVSSFNRQFNAFIGDLDCLSSHVKGSLFQQYCTSLYGVLFSQLYHVEFNKLCINWRKAMRRLFKLPCRAHCNLLPVITDILPVDVLTDTRFIRHLSSGLRHKNETVKFLFNMCFGLDRSVMACNIRHICNKYSIMFSNRNLEGSSTTVNQIKRHFYNSISEQHRVISAQVNELIVMRDLVCQEFNLDRNDICDIIEYLTTN